MKKVSFIVLAMMALLAIPTSTVFAQSDGRWFKVPFPFVVAEKQMPAGDYHVEFLYWNAVTIQRSGGNVSVIAKCQPTTVPASAAPKLIFHKYGRRYFLSEATLPNMDLGRNFYVTREEVEFASKMAKPDNIEVAAK
jgi:hypothetical protein